MKTADWEEWREKKIFKADDPLVGEAVTQPVLPARGVGRYKHQTAADHHWRERRTSVLPCLQPFG